MRDVGIAFRSRHEIVAARTGVSHRDDHAAHQLALDAHVVGGAVRLLDVVVERPSGPGDGATRERGLRERRPGDRRRRRKRRGKRRDAERAVERPIRVVVQTGAAANEGSPVAGDVPGEAEARREVLERRVARKRLADGEVPVGEDVPKRCVQAVGVSGNRVELVAQAEIQREPLGRPNVILQVEAEKRIGPHAVELSARQHALKPVRTAGEEPREVRERVRAADVGRRQLAGPQVLDEDAGLDQVTTLRVRHVVAERPIEAVVGRGIVGGAAHVREARHRDDPNDVLAGQERQLRRGRPDRKLLEPQAAVREPRRVEQRRRHDALVLDREELIARHRVGSVVREPDRHRLVGAVIGVPREDGVVIGQRQVDAPLGEVLARRIVDLVGVLGNLRAELPAVRARVEIEVRADERADRPERAASLGTVVTSVVPRSSCRRSTPPKKNILLRRMGPPADPPN